MSHAKASATLNLYTPSADRDERLRTAFADSARAAQWMKRGPSAELRVNSAGVLAKLESALMNDEVVRTRRAT
jgi:hypothetical protein